MSIANGASYMISSFISPCTLSIINLFLVYNSNISIYTFSELISRHKVHDLSISVGYNSSHGSSRNPKQDRTSYYIYIPLIYSLIIIPSM